MSWSHNRSPDPARLDLSVEDHKCGEWIKSPEPKQVSFASPEGAGPKAPNKLLLAAAAQNKSRLKQANLEAENAPGELKKNSCSSGPNSFLPEPIVGPDDTFQPPPWFMKAATIITKPSNSLAPTFQPPCT